MKRLVCIAEFPGFYYSSLSQDIDDALEQDIEYFGSDDHGDEEHAEFPKHIRQHPDFEAVACDKTWDFIEYQKCYLSMAQRWLKNFTRLIKDECPFPIDMQWEIMTSPREYNFETDRVFVEIEYKLLKKMYGHVMQKCRNDFELVLKDRFTSRSGFISFYSNCLYDWMEKPFKDFDHNEYGAVLSAYLNAYIDEDDLNYMDGRGSGDAHNSLYEGWNFQDWKSAVIEELSSRVAKGNDVGIGDDPSRTGATT